MSGPPGYEVEIRPVARSRRHLILPLVAALAILAVGAASNLLTSGRQRPVPPASPSLLSGPVAVDCGAMRAYDCRQAVEAARLAIADVPAAVEAAQAWPSLICGDNFDCPPQLLAASDPVGSVALTMSDRGVVWVNVFRVGQPNRLNETRQVLEARVVRWFPAPA